MIVYIILLTDIEKVGFKRSLIQKMDLGLKSSLIVYLAINMAFTSGVNMNSTFIARILFSNGAEVNEVY